MSRIGRKNIKIPDGVKVESKGDMIVIEGPKGKLEERQNPNVQITVAEREVSFKRTSDELEAKAAHGTMRSNLANMIKGVTAGFEKVLEINGVGYKAELKGDNIELSLGFSFPKVYKIPLGIKVEIDKGIRVKLSGIDKQLVGKVASEIRKIRPPEPYKQKGVKYSDEIIKKKVGKAAVTQAS